MGSCMVFGRIVCGKKPLANIKVTTDLRVRGASGFQVIGKPPVAAVTATDANGFFGTSLHIPRASDGEAIGSIAFINFTCPNGQKAQLKLTVQESKLASGQKTWAAILKAVTKKLLLELLKLPKLPELISPSMVALVVLAKEYDCCKDKTV